LIENHYHLVVETPKANLTIGMRQLNGIYTQAFKVGFQLHWRKMCAMRVRRISINFSLTRSRSGTWTRSTIAMAHAVGETTMVPRFPRDPQEVAVQLVRLLHAHDIDLAKKNHK
jgi:hypothetical protein